MLTQNWGYIKKASFANPYIIILFQKITVKEKNRVKYKQIFLYKNLYIKSSSIHLSFFFNY